MKTSGHLATLSFLLLALAGCNDSPPPRNSGSSPAESGNHLGQAAHAGRRTQKPVDLAAINKAIENFYLQEGRFPTNLTELALRDYIPIIPVLPAGLTWDYDTNSGIASVIKEAIKE